MVVCEAPVDGKSPISGIRLGDDDSMMRIVEGGLDDEGARKATGVTDCVDESLDVLADWTGCIGGMPDWAADCGRLDVEALDANDGALD